MHRAVVRRAACAAHAHNAPVAGGVFHFQRQQCQVFASAGRNQLAQRVGLGQRHIAGQHHHGSVVTQGGHRLLHGVAGAQLRLLAHKFHAKCAFCARVACAGCFYFYSAVAGNHDHLARLQGACGVNHMLQECAPGQLVQDLGQSTLHACAFARRHNDHVNRVRVAGDCITLNR